MKLKRSKAASFVNEGPPRQTSRKNESTRYNSSKHKSSEQDKKKHENRTKLVNKKVPEMRRSKRNYQTKPVHNSESIKMPSTMDRTKTGDIWVAIEIKMKSGRIKLLYYSIREQIGYWDRPPSGHGHIISGKTVSPDAIFK